MRDLSLLALLLTIPSTMFSQIPIFENKSVSNLPEISTQSKNSMDVKFGDIDNDDDLDIVVALEFVKNVILINDGTGNFSDESFRLPDIIAKQTTKPYPYYPYHDTEDIALEDFDNDGDLDLVFVTEDDQVNEFYLNRGDGHFVDHTDQFPVEGVSNGVLAGDFDGDGWIDLIVGNNGQNKYLKNSNGRFNDETKSRLPLVDDITQDLQAIDFDKDGDLDVIVANERTNRFLVNDGTGNFSDVTDKYFSDDVLQEETREATFSDIDKDGDYDIYFANVYMFQRVEPTQRLLVNQGKGGWFKDETSERLGFTNKFSIIDANFSDLDADGDADLILLTHLGPKLYQNNGKGYFSDITASGFGVLVGDGVDVEVGDLNGDGKLDIYIGCFRGSDLLLIQR